MNTPPLDSVQVTLEIPAKQLQILILLKQGKSRKEIASELFMSVGKVKQIVGVMLETFDCKNCTQLIGKLVERGIV